MWPPLALASSRVIGRKRRNEFCNNGDVFSFEVKSESQGVLVRVQSDTLQLRCVRRILPSFQVKRIVSFVEITTA
jgi:hypothetical protein